MNVVSLGARLERSLGARAAATAIECDGRSWTYGDLDRRSVAVAAALQGSGLGAGERILIGLPNGPELVIAILAALRSGAAVVPLNPLATADEVAYIASDAGAKVAVVTEPHATALRASSIASLERIATSLDERHEPAAVVDADVNAAALIVYTSGTTGRPKGVVLSHGAVGTNLSTVAAAWGWSAADRLLLTLPCFHMHGLGLGILASLVVGSTILLRRRFDVAEVIDDLVVSRATMFFGVPTMYNRLVALPEDGRPRPELRLWVSGSAPLSAATFERFRERFGAEILERYGMTECGFVLSAQLAGPRRPGAVGVPLPGADVRLIEPEWADRGEIREVESGATGEILIGGPSLFTGYWQRPEATAAAMLGGCLRSGDLARCDADGQFRIIGRLSVDILKTRGFKVGAGEIEDCLLRHPAVAEVAVVGVPDSDQGQRIVAAVTLRAGAHSTAEEIRAYARRHLAPHKVPARVEFLDEIPRTGPGKFKKIELIRRLSSEP